jgi:O-antigen biosynthesis protein
VGSNPPADVRNLAGNLVEVAGFVSDDVLSRYYSRSRVAVAPLRFGGGMKGKVAESMRFGVPMVTTSIGAQGFASANGALCVEDSVEGQAVGVLELLQNDDLWRKRSASGLTFARRNFSTDAMWSVFSDRL